MERNTELERVAEIFVGDWLLTITNQWWLDDPTTVTSGKATCEWLGDSFLRLQAEFDREPTWEFVFGRNDARDQFVVLLQQRALELLRAAAEEGQASRGDLAYLEDRVAVAGGEDQQYGTQIRCADDGTPVPATPIADESSVDERRAEAGLPPLEDYVAEMQTICAGAG